MEDVPGEDRVRRVRLGLDRRLPRCDRIAPLRPEARESEVELDRTALRVELRELLDEGYRLMCQIWIEHDIELEQDDRTLGRTSVP